MSQNSAAAGGPISLPQGGGALKGIGEKFSPDLFTGTGNFTVPFNLPPGRNGFQPQLNLVYSTGNGNGCFGLGWSLSIPGVTRKTWQGVPRYNETKLPPQFETGEKKDVFILSGAEDLVPVDGTYPGRRQYRPRTEGLFARIEHVQEPGGASDYWEVHSKDGLISTYGASNQFGSLAGQIVNPDDPGQVFAWKLTRTQDPFGNLIRYEYESDAGAEHGHRWDHPLLRSIQYADYGDPANPDFLVQVEFLYEDRPDPFSDYRAGFEIRTTQRCRAIRVTTREQNGALHPVREYRFTYTAARHNMVSLLTSLVVVGFDDDLAESQELPPFTFDYSRFEPEKRRFEPVTGPDLPASSLADPNLDLVDLHGCGLPDFIETNVTVRYWRNLGRGRFDLPRPMSEAPPHVLADPGVQLLDANGDGRLDLMVTQGPLAGYYPLTYAATWDRRSFIPYRQGAPTFNLKDPEVKLVDLDGDGRTDILRSGARLEHYFNHPDPDLAWQRTAHQPRRALADFPDVTFSDPRVRLADMTGDGLPDIVLIHDGNVEYWPNLGHGRWGKRLTMLQGPRFPYGYDPRRLLVVDVDGDGLADFVYVDHGQVHLWLNRSGNSWSEEIIIPGTPPVTDMDNVRLVDLLGTGVSGVLWTRDATGFNHHRMMFLDLSGGLKPYLLQEMDNQLGALTRVEYKPSIRYFLEDQKTPARRWRTPLPFPVQVVAKVEAMDRVSQGKLTTEYFYHHGYWDGAEREFRGFGMVEQRDTETFEDYHGPGLHESTSFQSVGDHFSPPILTKTWFHQGPVGEEYGDWAEVDYTDEYWPGDPQLLEHTAQVNAFLQTLPFSPQNRRIRRDALRTLRGSILRTELYALDGSTRQDRPYTVTEHAYNLREMPTSGEDDRPWIFFPHLVAQRTTQWERGDDPLTHFTLTDDYDDFGRPARQTAVAPPRRADKRISWTVARDRTVSPDETRVLATHILTAYAVPPDNGRYIHDRVAQNRTYELIAPPGPPDGLGDDLSTILPKQWAEARRLRDIFKNHPDTMRLFNHTVNHYDGPAFQGEPAGVLGPYGALVRTETLVLTEDLLDGAYNDPLGSRRPESLPVNAPPGSISTLGYRREHADATHINGWYADTQRRQYDFQTGAAPPQGLVRVTKDALGRDTTFDYDPHYLLPIKVIDAKGLVTTAAYNYRVLQPERLTDPNGTTTHLRYTPLGLPARQFITGLDAFGNETLGGTDDHPEISFQYDFRHFEHERKPIYVHTSRRVHHAQDAVSDEVIESREYSDGYGHLVQTRAQAEDWISGETGDGVGLPLAAGVVPGPAVVRRVQGRVVVSGWQIYDNKGRVVEKYEPFFAVGWEFQPEAEATYGRHATLFYDPRGTVSRTVNPDGSQQRVILGRPDNPTGLALTLSDLQTTGVPGNFEPSPWETYTYDANDLAELTHPGAGRASDSHLFTPAGTLIDALGRVLWQVQRNGPDPAHDWFSACTTYDLRGNALSIQDALGREAFRHTYDLLNRPLRVESIDGGLRTSVLDAQGNLATYRDSKGSLVQRTYDELNRFKELRVRDGAGGTMTVREQIVYGDEGTHALARANHTLGRPVRHYDEAGLLEMPRYDFKGNLLEKARRTIRDDRLALGWQADWSTADAGEALETTSYRTNSRYDALNRPVELTYPADVEGEHKQLIPHYNRAGALEAVSLDEADYVRHIAYNARGQRVLIAYGNDVMTRHAYDPQTFRLARLRSDRLNPPGFAQRLADLPPEAGNTQSFQASGPPIQDFVYSYDLAGNITAIDERVPNCGVLPTPNVLLRLFAYDPVYRLTAVTGRACRDIGHPRGLDDDPRCGFYPGAPAATTPDNAPALTESYTESFRYDPTGNLLDLTYRADSGAWSRSFGLGGLPIANWAEAPDNRLTSLENGLTIHTYQFDANGNLIRQNTERFHTWDHADRMIGYHVQAGSTPSLQARYLYGADGLRVKKWVRRQSGQVNTTIYVDGAFEHHRQIDPAGATRENNTIHIMDNQSRIALVRVGDSLDDREVGPTVAYHLGDHLGGSHIVLGGADAGADDFINREEYFPYGETSFGSFSRKRYRYSGKERDEESGLDYYGARYYGPWLARWLSKDPLSPLGNSNVFEYVNDNPMRFFDFTGGQSVDITSPGRPEPMPGLQWVESDKLPDKTLAAYKRLHQYNFESEIRNDFFGLIKQYERHVPNPRAGLNQTAAQKNKQTECVPTTIRNYLRIVLRYDFATEGIEQLIDEQAQYEIPWVTGTLADIKDIDTSYHGLKVLERLLPEVTFRVHYGPATEEHYVELAKYAMKFAPVIIQLEKHVYLLEGVNVVDGQNIFKIRDPSHPDKTNLKFQDLSFSGISYVPEPSFFHRAHEELKKLKPSPPPVDHAKEAIESIRR